MRPPDAERFDRLAASYDEKVPLFATLGELLVDWVRPVGGARILDLGCGRGAVTKAITRRLGSDCEVVAGDVASGMLERLRAERLQGVEVRYLDATDIDEDAASFDVVFCAFLLHFLAAAPQALTEVVRVLRPGGTFAMSVPGHSADGDWSDEFDRLVSEFHERVGLPASGAARDWEELAGEAGLRPRERTHVEVSIPLDGAEVHLEWLLAHSLSGVVDRLDEGGQAELRRRLSVALRTSHPDQGRRLIVGADCYQMTLAR